MNPAPANSLVPVVRGCHRLTVRMSSTSETLPWASFATNRYLIVVGDLGLAFPSGQIATTLKTLTRAGAVIAGVVGLYNDRVTAGQLGLRADRLISLITTTTIPS